MYRTALALTSAALMLLTTASPAAAEEHAYTINACGSVLTIEELKAQINEQPGEAGFAMSGNVVLRLSDEDSSVVLRLPGRLNVEFTDAGDIVTQTGRTLLSADPAYPFMGEAHALAGLPEMALISGQLVYTYTFDPVTGEPTSLSIDSVKGRVIDVCELLAR
jgi:hypothetical protein